MRYGVKVMYTYFIECKNKRFFEESVLLVNADSFDDALHKAEAYAKDREREYINCDNHVVKIEKIEAIDSFLVFENEEIVEVYSSFKNNKTPLSDNKYYKILGAIADSKELYPLRHN